MSNEVIRVGSMEIRYLVDGSERDGLGVFETTATAPAGVASASIWLQAWMPDPAGPHGWSATRAQRSPPP